MSDTLARPDAPLLSARNLAVGYAGGGEAVARGLDLDLRAGDLVCLLGPNGAGKSTLLRTLAGLQPPLAGEIRWRGGYLPADAAERARNIAIVLTERVQVGNLSVYDLAALGRTPHSGWSGRLSAADREAVDAALQEAGAWDLRHRPFDATSDGEKQKALLARALAQAPALLLLDEPTAFLDLPRRVEAMRLLRRISREKGRAVLLSTHDLDLALRAADRLWLLAPGGRLRAGVPEDLALQGAVGEVFDQGDVAFDKATGEFQVHGHPLAAAAVEGEADLKLWVTRALEREGYRVGADPGGPQPEVRLKAARRDGRPVFAAAGRGWTGEFASVEELIAALRRKSWEPC